VKRQCSRTGCAEPATATLGYDYAQARAWVDQLSAERDPHDYDLCGRHASRITVPSGWELLDLRCAGVERLAS